jgi:hypothetical protein
MREGGVQYEGGGSAGRGGEDRAHAGGHCAAREKIEPEAESWA